MLPLWALFLMPMIVAAFTTLLAQIEFQARGSDRLLSLPNLKWQVFMATTVVIYLALTGMTLLALIFTFVGALLGGLIGGHPPTGEIRQDVALQRSFFARLGKGRLQRFRLSATLSYNQLLHLP